MQMDPVNPHGIRFYKPCSSIPKRFVSFFFRLDVACSSLLCQWVAMPIDCYANRSIRSRRMTRMRYSRFFVYLGTKRRGSWQAR